MKRAWAYGALLLGIAVALYFAVKNASSSKKSASTRPSSAQPRERTEPPLQRAPLIPTATSAARAMSPPAGTEREGATVFFARWGGAADELGRERPQEGNPMGPMSVAVDAKGRVSVLDGVNGRIVRRGRDGKLDRSLPIDVPYPEDIAVADDGSSAVLDRFRDKAVTVYDDSGRLRGKLQLAGNGVDDPGSVTGVFVDGSDVYVEREHATLVQLGSLDGVPADPRKELPGRPSRDGLSLLSAGIIEAPAGRVYVASIVRASMQQRFTRELDLDGFARNIVLLDTDKAGTIYFAVDIDEAGGQEVVLLQCLDGTSGEPVGSARLPANTLPEESFRDLTVLDDGGVIQALRTENGVSYARYYCQ